MDNRQGRLNLALVHLTALAPVAWTERFGCVSQWCNRVVLSLCGVPTVRRGQSTDRLWAVGCEHRSGDQELWGLQPFFFFIDFLVPLNPSKPSHLAYEQVGHGGSSHTLHRVPAFTAQQSWCEMLADWICDVFYRAVHECFPAAKPGVNLSLSRFKGGMQWAVGLCRTTAWDSAWMFNPPAAVTPLSVTDWSRLRARWWWRLQKASRSTRRPAAWKPRAGQSSGWNPKTER